LAKCNGSCKDGRNGGDIVVKIPIFILLRIYIVRWMSKNRFWKRVVDFSTDRALYEGIKANDSKAFSHLYKENYWKVAKYIRANNGGEEDAEEILQEGIILLWEKVISGAYVLGESGSISGYLLGICRNKWRNVGRKGHAKYMTALDDGMDFTDHRNVLDVMEEEEDIQYLYRLFRKLGDKCQDILRLFYFDRWSLKEIAEKYHSTDRAMKTKRYECMKKLKKFHAEANGI